MEPITRVTAKQVPAWTGPCKDGISFSRLNRFLECRERFRLYAILGVREELEYSDAIIFGYIWHAAEQAYSSMSKKKRSRKNGVILRECFKAGKAEAVKAISQYPSDAYRIDCAYLRFKTLWPYYLQYWREHHDIKNKVPVYQEQEFRASYILPHSGRRIYIKGVFDAVDILDKKLYVQENKTKSRIDSQGITATLFENLQTMMYVTALQNLPKKPTSKLFPSRVLGEFGGVRYNVVYNSGHMVGGSRTTVSDYCKRIEADPRKWFYHWRVELYKSDIDKFQRHVLNPILEQLCDWYEWITSADGLHDPFSNPIHWQSPWGTYNSLAGGWRGSYFGYLTRGDITGLYPAKPYKPTKPH